MAYRPITKKKAQKLAEGYQPVYGEVDGQRYRLTVVGRVKCRTICGKTLYADRVKFDDGMSIGEKQ